MLTAEKIKKPQSELAYKKVLELYQANPDNAEVKQFVFRVGRWHFGNQRFWVKPNAHDEQPIQTDILVRSR